MFSTFTNWVQNFQRAKKKKIRREKKERTFCGGGGERRAHFWPLSLSLHLDTLQFCQRKDTGKLREEERTFSFFFFFGGDYNLQTSKKRRRRTSPGENWRIERTTVWGGEGEMVRLKVLSSSSFFSMVIKSVRDADYRIWIHWAREWGRERELDWVGR